MRNARCQKSGFGVQGLGSARGWPQSGVWGLGGSARGWPQSGVWGLIRVWGLGFGV